MSDNEMIVLSDEYAPEGIRESGDILELMITSDGYGLRREESNYTDILDGLILPCYDGQSDIVSWETVSESVWAYNEQLMCEWAFTKLIEDSDPEEILEMTKEAFSDSISSYEEMLLDYLSYNGMLDDSYEIAKYLRKEQISCECSIDDDCVYSVIFPRDGNDIVTLNHCQSVMFKDIFEYQSCDKEIEVFNMGSNYIHLANY